MFTNECRVVVSWLFIGWGVNPRQHKLANLHRRIRIYNGELRELNEFSAAADRPRVCKTQLPITVGRDLRQHPGRHLDTIRGCHTVATALKTQQKAARKTKAAFSIGLVCFQ